MFGLRSITKLDIVSLGLLQSQGAYYRKELMVFDRCSLNADSTKNRSAAIYMIAHEIGHNWFTGADTSTWEDWLNETGANWASLLYALNIEDSELFKYILKLETTGYEKMPIIRSPDGRRPDNGVHSRGTALFYAVYQKFGREAVLSALQLLAYLTVFTTNDYLNRLNDERPEIGIFIENRLNTERY